jgi:hypothetical protein
LGQGYVFAVVLIEGFVGVGLAHVFFPVEVVFDGFGAVRLVVVLEFEKAADQVVEEVGVGFAGFVDLGEVAVDFLFEALVFFEL